MTRIPLALLACIALSGCGGNDQSSPKDTSASVGGLEPIALEMFEPHSFVVNTKSVPGREGEPTAFDETLKYSLHAEQERLVAKLHSLRYAQLRMYRGADVTRLMAFAKQPRHVMQKALDGTFDTPYARFQMNERGQDFDREIVANRDSILLIGENAVGVISLFLAPRNLDLVEWQRDIEMPTNDGVRFRGQLFYKVLGDRDDKNLVSVSLSGRLTADGDVKLIMAQDMPAAFQERRAARRKSARIDQSSWTFKGILDYNREMQQWAGGKVRTRIRMRIHTAQGTTQKRSEYMMVLVSSLSLAEQKREGKGSHPKGE